jgi:L-2,4-diaminobutyric acid acetyltransferase
MELSAQTDGREAVAMNGLDLSLSFRPPRAEDGPAIWSLVAGSAPLDANSRYCNLLQCDHFAETCVVAETSDGIVGWTSAYRVPSAPEELFVWQVAVRADARGAGLGGRMLDTLIRRPAAEGCRRLTATVTESNHASLAMLAAFARRGGMQLSRGPKFDQHRHFEGLHETEFEVSIGPLPTSATARRSSDDRPSEAIAHAAVRLRRHL